MKLQWFAVVKTRSVTRIVTAGLLFLLAACSEPKYAEQLPGSWQGESASARWCVTYNEDGAMRMDMHTFAVEDVAPTRLTTGEGAWRVERGGRLYHEYKVPNSAQTSWKVYYIVKLTADSLTYQSKQTEERHSIQRVPTCEGWKDQEKQAIAEAG